MRFEHWYSAESVCSPSRMALMTGRLPTRMGMPHTVFTPGSSKGLPTEEKTIGIPCLLYFNILVCLSDRQLCKLFIYLMPLKCTQTAELLRPYGYTSGMVLM